MNKQLIFTGNKLLRWVMKTCGTPLLIFLLLMMFAGPGQAQVTDDPNYSVILGAFQGLPGTIVKMPVYFKNYDTVHVDIDGNPLNGTLGAFVLRFEYNTQGTSAVPHLLQPIVDYAEINEQGDTLAVYFKTEIVGRGLKMALIDTTLNATPGWDTAFPVFAFPSPADDTLSPVMFIQFLPTAYDATIHLRQPVVPGSPDSSIIMYVPFRVNSGAVLGNNTLIMVKNDSQMGDPRINQFSDSTGSVYIEPRRNYVYFTVAAPVNHAPVVTVPSTTYSRTTGQQLTFAVSASDQDGDTVTLSATGLPSGATFTPSNPVVGEGSVSGTFTWTPGSAGTFNVTFSANDKPGLTGTKQVTINVTGGTGNNAPVVTVPASSYEITQGESVTFSVSAYDPDGNSLCLEAVGLPPGATFNPSNPCGSGTVMSTFTWTTNFSQKGVFAVTFRGTDSFGLPGERTVVITVKELDVDRLYTTSVFGDAPVGGIPGARPVAFPIDLASKHMVYGIQFDMFYPLDIANLDSFLVTDRMPEYIIYDNIGETPGKVRVVAFGLNSEPVVDGTSPAIMNAYFTLDTAAQWGDYWVHFDSAQESVDPDYTIPSKFLVVDSGIIQIDRLGDVNLDRFINVADIVNVVYNILGRVTFPKRNFETANVAVDSMVNVVDLVGIINMIFGRPIIPSPSPASYEGNLATFNIEHDDLIAGQLSKLSVRGEFPEEVAALQLQIDYDPSAVEFFPPELGAAAGSFTLQSYDDQAGRMRVVVYTLSKSTIQAGQADVLYLPTYAKKQIAADDKTKIKITQAFLSNPTAGNIPVKGEDALLPTTFKLHQNYPNPFNPTTRIEFEIGQASRATQPVKLVVYNILGQNLKTLVDEQLPPGRHSVIWDATDDGGARVATGIYFYRLEVGDKSESKKMLLLK